MPDKNVEPKNKIVAVHLLNDFSGSPLIFSQALHGLQQSGHEVVLHTSAAKDGFLNNLKVESVEVPYRFYQNSLLRLLAFISSQVIVFVQLMRYRKEDVTIYINTLLPFGAALAGRLMGKRVVYHFHESYIRPAALKRFLKAVAGRCADTALYVSNYLLDAEKIDGLNNVVVYNALPDEFVGHAESSSYCPLHEGFFNVLMVCSFKQYKGVDSFIQLSKRHPKIHFDLVLNAGIEEVAQLIRDKSVPKNIIIHSTQRYLQSFYQRASLVVNLTDPDFCIETFGMTLLEAMCYGVPVIAPNVGGPMEIVQSGENGFTLDVRRADELDATLNNLYSHPELCAALSKGALATAGRFSSQKLKSTVTEILGN